MERWDEGRSWVASAVLAADGTISDRQLAGEWREERRIWAAAVSIVFEVPVIMDRGIRNGERH